jgi:hypothetical protein
MHAEALRKWLPQGRIPGAPGLSDPAARWSWRNYRLQDIQLSLFEIG